MKGDRPVSDFNVEEQIKISTDFEKFAFGRSGADESMICEVDSDRLN